jgi:hypothetical protein
MAAPPDLSERMLELRQLRKRVHNLERLAAADQKLKNATKVGSQNSRTRK